MKCSLALSFCVLTCAAFAQDNTGKTTIVLRNARLISGVTETGRVPIYRDPFQYGLLGHNAWPVDIEPILEAAEDAKGWREIEADEKGVFAGPELSRAYLVFEINVDAPGAYVLKASGHSAALVNGVPRVGNPYGSWYEIPVTLKAGTNQLVCSVGRGRFQGSLGKLDKLVYLAGGDHTLPDWLRGESKSVWAAAPLVNATSETKSFVMETQVGSLPPTKTIVGPVLPMALRKVGFEIQAPPTPAAGKLDVRVRLLDAVDHSQLLDERTIQIAVRDPTAKHRRTFRSAIDGSIQYFGVVPAAGTQPKDGEDEPSERPALVLTLHGASVEGMGQANVYSHKPDMVIVAPTNRRPFGFDWEDWGRRDAIEVLNIAQAIFDTDPRRTYLTGHSMGGHGTWNLSAIYPDRFAAIGPSAGWVSFFSYGSTRHDTDDAVSALLRRAANGSDTLLMRDNYRQLGVYMLHGDADDNVPVTEARTMRAELGQFHTDFTYYEKPGAGHWWGDACCDWPPMFEFFRRHQRATSDEISAIDFTTVNPGVSSRYEWLTVAQQHKPLAASRVQLRYDDNRTRLSGSTENVALLSLDLAAACPAGKPASSSAAPIEPAPAEITLVLDGQELSLPRRLHWLRHMSVVDSDGAAADERPWQISTPPAASEKGPHRYGPFKAAFDQNAVLVYGTQGSADENAWAVAKARYDAEQFWYRGNGSFDVIPDAQFDAKTHADRSVILYGNADTNSAWQQLLGACPVQVTRERVTVGERVFAGSDLLTVFTYPRLDGKAPLVGVVGGTGLAGARATTFLRYFVSGAAFPDLLVASNKVLLDKEQAVRAVGFFDSRWSLDESDVVFGRSD